MRLVALGLALALGAAAAAPAPAQTGSAALAPNEVLLEVGAIGTVTVPADLATFTVAFSGTGADEAAARADLEGRYRNIVAAARRLGVPADAIRRNDSNPYLRTFDVREEPPPLAPGEEAPPVPAPSAYAGGSVAIRVTDMTRIAELARALDTAAAVEPGNASPVYGLTDDRAGRTTARAKALASVRADADAYAASLNLRVVRMVRVTERTGVEMLPHLFGDDPAIMRQAFSGPHRDPAITVFVVLGVDFVLAPR